MFRVMTEKEMLNINGGFYNVPVYWRLWRVIQYKHDNVIVKQESECISCFFVYERQVANGSGINAFYLDHFTYSEVSV